jgi:hypothetical protein
MALSSNYENWEPSVSDFLEICRVLSVTGIVNERKA